MESNAIPTIPGTPFAGGFYAGRIDLGGKEYALIVAPKSSGEQEETIWISDWTDVPDANSYYDGLANTNAMAEAGSELAKWARGLRIGDHDDWYLPSQDELEIVYRNLKPTARENYCWARSGMNLSAMPPTRPYLPEDPIQTWSEPFQAGGAEAFAPEWYWTSTQHAADSGYAWIQCFGGGNQDSFDKDCSSRARAVRRFLVI